MFVCNIVPKKKQIPQRRRRSTSAIGSVNKDIQTVQGHDAIVCDSFGSSWDQLKLLDFVDALTRNSTT